jgi:LysR family transcriptional activator of glutamate synthase operon
MEIWQLNTFKVVAEVLHFTRASKELKLTQSAVSHQIKSLEEELGVTLFSRNRRQISLTAQGSRVLDYANQILNQVDVMRQEIEENKGTLEGTIKIVAVTRSLNSPFYQIKQDFEALYPKIDLFFESVIAHESIFENVRKGISDIGFTAQTEGYEDLLSIPYGKFELLLVVGNNHRLASRKEVDLTELQNDSWFLFEPGSWFRKKTDEIFSAQNFIPHQISESNDGATIFLLIKDGAGVGFLPRWGIIDGLEEKKIIPVKLKGVKNYSSLSLVIKPENRSKLVSLFIDYLLRKQIEGIDIYKKTESNNIS